MAIEPLGHEGPDGHEGRISSLETAMVALAGDVKDIAFLVREQNASLTTSIREQAQQSTRHYEDLSARISEKDKPQWGVYFAGLSLLLAFVVAIGAAAMAPVYLVGRRNEADIAQLVNSTTAHVHLEGHPATMAMHSAEAKSAAMQREDNHQAIRDLNDSLQTAIGLAIDSQQMRSAAVTENLRLEIAGIRDTVTSDKESNTLQLLIEALRHLKMDGP